MPIYASTVYHLAFSPANWIIRYYDNTAGLNFDLNVVTSYPTLPNPIHWSVQGFKNKYSMYANYIPTLAILQNISYTYDPVGNITKIVNSSPTNASSTITYTYDDLNRLISATATGTPTSVPAYTQTYTYDALGNILTKSDVGSFVRGSKLFSFRVADSLLAPSALSIHRSRLEAALFEPSQDLVLGEADIRFHPQVRDEYTHIINHHDPAKLFLPYAVDGQAGRLATHSREECIRSRWSARGRYKNLPAEMAGS